MSRPSKASGRTVFTAAVATTLGAALVLVALMHRDGAVYPSERVSSSSRPSGRLASGCSGSSSSARSSRRRTSGSGQRRQNVVAMTTRWVGRLRVGPAIALPVIVALSASLWTVLAAETTIPRVLGDELIYSGLGKSLAEHGSYLLRGDPDTGHSLLYPLLISPAYGLTRNGVDAHVAVQTLNAVLFSLTAVPAYFLARRVVAHGLATLVAVLAVMNPWGGFSAWVMTESAFYLLFTIFALVLVLALERPTISRQLVVIGLIVALAAIRTQAAVIPAAVIAAVLVVGVSRRAIEQHAARTAPSARCCSALCSSSGPWCSSWARSARTRRSSTVRFSPISFVRWVGWNTGAFALSSGIAAAVTLPAALVGLLRRSASAGERATGAATVTLTVAMIVAVGVLSATGFGFGYIQERSVFYVAPARLHLLRVLAAAPGRSPLEAHGDRCGRRPGPRRMAPDARRSAAGRRRQPSGSRRPVRDSRRDQAS